MPYCSSPLKVNQARDPSKITKQDKKISMVVRARKRHNAERQQIAGGHIEHMMPVYEKRGHCDPNAPCAEEKFFTRSCVPRKKFDANDAQCHMKRRSEVVFQAQPACKFEQLSPR